MGAAKRLKGKIIRWRDRKIRDLIDRVYFRKDEKGRRYMAGTLMVEEDVWAGEELFRPYLCPRAIIKTKENKMGIMHKIKGWLRRRGCRAIWGKTFDGTATLKHHQH